MFKHQDPLSAANAVEVKPKDIPTVEEKMHAPAPTPSAAPSAELLRELMEKNLKWSQIIYEQNRKINRKLAWAAAAEWLRLLLVLVPLILGIIFIGPMLQQAYGQYAQLLDLKSTTTTPSYESLLKMIPLNSAQQEQIQQMLK